MRINLFSELANYRIGKPLSSRHPLCGLFSVIISRRLIVLELYPMLGKILLTSAVIIIAFLYIKQRNLKEAAGKRRGAGTVKSSKKGIAEDSLAADFRVGAYMFLVLMVGFAAALYYFNWQDDHSILTITLYSDIQSEPVRYQVFKYQLQENSFTTLDGTRVTVASSERMEIQGLD